MRRGLPGIAPPFRSRSAAGPHAWSVRRTSLLALGAGGVAAMLAACGGSSKNSSPSTSAAQPPPVNRTTTQQQQKGGGAGALKAEAASAATGDIPDNQVFLTLRNGKAGYSIKFPEGWAQSGGGNTVTFRDKNNIVR